MLFEESSFPYQKEYQSFLHPLDTPLLSAWQSEYRKDQPPVEPTVAPEEEYTPQVQQNIQPQPPATPASSQSTGSIFSEADFPPLTSPAASPAPQVQDVPQPAHVHPMITRAKDGIRKPNPRYVLLSVTSQYPEPRTVAATLKDPNWTNAMRHEKNNMDITHTWDLVPPDPSIKPISSGWVHKSKLNADGTLNK